MQNNENSFDDKLDNAFNEEDTDTIDINNDESGDNNEETSQDVEAEETLESLMQSIQEKTTEKSNKTDTNVNNNQQNAEQSRNKQQRTNNSKDLIDKDGNVIAKAGAERRFYEENVRLKREKEDFTNRILPTIRKNYEDMRTKAISYEKAINAMQLGDLTPEEINTGIDLIRNWKKSPENTMKLLLTQAKSYGINLDNTTSSIDMAAISQMFDQKLQPFIQERENAIRNQEIKQRSQEIYNNFMYKYPDAKIHNKELAYLARKNPNMSLDAVYYQLKNHYLENGYDFNTPLVEIIKNKATKSNNKSAFNNVNTNQTINAQNIRQPIASVNRSYEDIIKETMRNIKK